MFHPFLHGTPAGIAEDDLEEELRELEELAARLEGQHLRDGDGEGVRCSMV